MLILHALPAVNVYLPKDRVTNSHQGYGFVEFRSEEDADYAIKVLNMIKMYAKPIRVNKASQDKKTQDVGANLFIGNLDPDVDEKVRGRGSDVGMLVMPLGRHVGYKLHAALTACTCAVRCVKSILHSCTCTCTRTRMACHACCALVCDT